MRPYLILASIIAVTSTSNAQTVTKYVRYSHANATSYGILEGEVVRELSGNLFESPKPTGKRLKLSDVQLLTPCEPSKVIAVGLNYQTHLGQRSAAQYPGLFIKLPTTLTATNTDIVLPSDAKNTHYEGEMVVVIGKRAKNVSLESAKATDTFGPLGPAIAAGVNYDDLLLQT